MRTGKEVEWTQVNFASYSLKDYYDDIPIIKVASHYVRLQRDEIIKDLYRGTFVRDSSEHHITVDITNNYCEIDEEYTNPEELITLFEGEDIDPVPIIKELTDVDQEDYCTEVEYADGTIELLEVKGKILLIGGSKK